MPPEIQFIDVIHVTRCELHVKVGKLDTGRQYVAVLWSSVFRYLRAQSPVEYTRAHKVFLNMGFHPALLLYSLIQWVLDKFLSPTPPTPKAILGRPRIAVIGAGLTGVSSASHCVGHGFDITIFEAGDERSLGGIWSVRWPSACWLCYFY